MYAGRADGNFGGGVDYEPNSFGGPVEDHSVSEPPLRLEGDAARYDFKNDDEDYYGQPRLFWRRRSTTRAARTSSKTSLPR